MLWQFRAWRYSASVTFRSAVACFRGHWDEGLGRDRDEGLGRDRQPGGAPPRKIGDLVAVSEREADVVEAFHEPPARVVVDLEAGADAAASHLAGLEINRDLGVMIGFDGVEQHPHLG